MIPCLRAVSFTKVLSTGRTQPFLAVCEEESGTQHEIVVKTRAGMESAEDGLICELMAALLAKDLDIPVAEPVLVDIEADFAQAIPDPAMSKMAQGSLGLNYGSRFLGPGWVTWPPGRGIPLAVLPIAADIFAFDVLIQNPDRRRANPNLLRRGDDLVVYDHETAFSFLYSIVPGQYPWEGKGIDYIREHVFFNALRGKALSWGRFVGALEAIDKRRLQEYSNSVPADWRKGKNTVERILEYLGKSTANVRAMIRRIGAVLQ